LRRGRRKRHNTAMTAPSPSPRKGIRFLQWPVMLLLTLCVVPELVLQASDMGLGGIQGLRALAYGLGAFQIDLLSGPGPYFAVHSLTMFLTYGFLHTGLSHLIINMIGLVWLGGLVLENRTSETFLTFYLLATVGAAEAFALIGTAGGTMVGASGALFGLLGVYLVDSGLLMGSLPKDRLAPRIARVFAVAVILALSDIASRFLLGSTVAWQAHAGGFVTGGLLALIAPPRGRKAAEK
jgi:rhomboid protease GluP